MFPRHRAGNNGLCSVYRRNTPHAQSHSVSLLSRPVLSYYYHREIDGWYKEEVPAERVAVKDCPISVRDALFDYDEVVVKRF